jgi:hypothetical protein
MSLDTEQVARLLSAGSVAIPCFPEPGQVSLDQNGFTIRGRSKPEKTVQVVHHPSPAHKNTFVIQLNDVSAIYLPDGLAAGDGPLWLIGEEIQNGQVNVDALERGSRPGSVFVREDGGVLMRTESAKTASEVASYPRNCL